jgi:hypothetical protein
MRVITGTSIELLNIIDITDLGANESSPCGLPPAIQEAAYHVFGKLIICFVTCNPLLCVRHNIDDKGADAVGCSNWTSKSTFAEQNKVVDSN